MYTANLDKSLQLLLFNDVTNNFRESVCSPLGQQALSICVSIYLHRNKCEFSLLKVKITFISMLAGYWVQRYFGLDWLIAVQ